MSTKFARRMVLRGTLAGGVVSVGLPMLECFLNSNGTAQVTASVSGGKFVISDAAGGAASVRKPKRTPS